MVWCTKIMNNKIIQMVCAYMCFYMCIEWESLYEFRYLLHFAKWEFYREWKNVYLPSGIFLWVALKLEVGGRVNGFFWNDEYSSRMIAYEKRSEIVFFFSRVCNFCSHRKLTNPLMGILFQISFWKTFDVIWNNIWYYTKKFYVVFCTFLEVREFCSDVPAIFSPKESCPKITERWSMIIVMINLITIQC